ncbi:hypothetical protein N7508_004909 [Penicillium antarcticum]|uniref:uncharacterized protein n=1 Tax=Penicillium antarcticum TaxID=416450 RepID=UPI00238452E3|nr:uncharacterized protein N7508_004909 [Penicillium antarcticum]KAJ5305894.1 hypothetical protein N7508_004909 [Penicillium antarcticum]
MARPNPKRDEKKKFSWVNVLETLYDDLPQDYSIQWASGVDDILKDFKRGSILRKHPVTFDRAMRVSDLAVVEHGVRYIHRKSDITKDLLSDSSDSNVYRTVKIEGLRQHIEAKDILSYVRGGVVFSAAVYDTVSLIGSYTAIIIFVEEQGAVNFLDRVRRQGYFIPLETVYVTQITTPTYPILRSLHDLIHNKDRRRTLVFNDCEETTDTVKTLKTGIHRFLCKIDRIDRFEAFGENDPTGLLSVRFVSIAAAIDIQVLLKRHPNFHKYSPTFGIDPCAH